MKSLKLVLALIVGLSFITSCTKDDGKITIPTEENLVTQVITSQGGTINAPDDVQVIFPEGSVTTNTEVTVGYTGNENFIIPNTNVKVIGKPFTLKINIDTLQQNVQIKIPKPAGYVQNNTAVVASSNSIIPLFFEEVGNFLLVSFDNLPLIIANENNNTRGIGKTFIIGLVAGKQLPMDAELGLKQVIIDNTGKMAFSNLSNVTSDDKVLIMVHGWTSSPSCCWTEFLTKIQSQISQSGYTKVLTFGYYSGSPINNNGAVLTSQIQNYLNGATIDIITHSMGGLVSRSAIENYNMEDHVRNMITLGTPHKGAGLAEWRQLLGRKLKTQETTFIQSLDLHTQGMNDLRPSSDFIINLNRNPAPSTNYYPIAGNHHSKGVVKNSDGVVSLESALGIQNNENQLIGKIFFIEGGSAHTRLTGDVDVIAHVAAKLNSFNPPIPTNGLVAYYPFNGNANDESGNVNNGTVEGNLTLSRGRKNELNGAYLFPGEPFNYISVPHSSSLQSDTFTLNAWVYTDTDYANGYILNKGRDIRVGSYRLYVNGVGATVLYGGTNDAWFSELPSINNWHMVTGIVSGDNAKFYLDGVLVDEQTLSYPFVCTDTSPLTIGMHYYDGVPSYWAYPYKGKLDDIRIYNRTLSFDEVQSLYRE